MDLVEMYHSQGRQRDIEFAVFQGGPLRSNNPEYLERARRLEAEGKLKIYENLKKNDYYKYSKKHRGKENEYTKEPIIATQKKRWVIKWTKCSFASFILSILPFPSAFSSTPRKRL
jgi:hypothetical protein